MDLAPSWPFFLMQENMLFGVVVDRGGGIVSFYLLNNMDFLFAVMEAISMQ